MAKRATLKKDQKALGDLADMGPGDIPETELAEAEEAA